MPSPTNPVAFTILGLDIRWYAVFITSSIIISTLIIYKRAYKHNLSSDNVLTLILTGLPFGIIGARFYYVAGLSVMLGVVSTQTYIQAIMATSSG